MNTNKKSLSNKYKNDNKKLVKFQIMIKNKGKKYKRERR